MQINLESQLSVLLLMVPIVATIIGIARHIVGIKSLGIYAPIVLTFSFYVLGLNGKYGQFSDLFTGIRYGLITISVVIIVSFLAAFLTKKAHLHYFPKIAISISLVALAMLLVVNFADAIGKDAYNSVNVLAIILLVSVSEQLTSIIAKQSLRSAIFLTIETLAISILADALISWPSLQVALFNYPYLILLTLPVNYFVGKYKGLRIREYWRFRQILNSETEEN